MKKISARKLASYFILTILLDRSPLFAATDGGLGTTSTGSLEVSLSIPNLVRISHMADLNFGTYSGNGDQILDHDVCVWTNVASGNYKVQIRGDGASNAFTVSNGSGGVIPYSIKWNTATGTSGNFSVTANQLSGALSGASTTSSDCSGGDTANYQAKFTQSALLAARPGTYTGVLTVIITP